MALQVHVELLGVDSARIGYQLILLHFINALMVDTLTRRTVYHSYGGGFGAVPRDELFINGENPYNIR